MRAAMARPAASSLALFTRRPDERRCIDVESEFAEVDKLRCAFNDETLVLMLDIKISFKSEVKTEVHGQQIFGKLELSNAEINQVNHVYLPF
jgi:hypothetical protein